MDANELKRRASRLAEVNKILAKLDPAIRTEAFELLKGYVTEDAGEAPRSGGRQTRTPSKATADVTSRDKFFAKLETDEPSDNALAIAAYLYGLYGSISFTVDEVRELATDIGLTIPSRIDMTFKQMKRNKRALFKKAGKGSFALTVHGEAAVKETFSVKKGTQKKPPAKTDDAG